MSAKPRPLTILFADIGGSAALYERVGDVEAYRLIADSLTRMRISVEENDGKVLRTVGDAVLASFEHSDSAFLGACAIQRTHQDMPLAVRVGFHTGEVIPDRGDVYGHAVNIAARVAAFARIDEIVATAEAVEQLSEVHQSYSSSADLIDVRGVPEPVAVHRLQWQEQPTAVTRLASREDFENARQQTMHLQITHAGRVIQIGANCEDISMGRASDNQIAVVNDEASRHHATIRFRYGQFLLQDESTNGTYVKKISLSPFLVRRDSIVLDGAGVICLGAVPDLPGAELIEFKMLED